MANLMSSIADVIYFDNNATTPLAPEVCHAINTACVNAFANPSSASVIGKAAKKLIIESRSEIAQMINADFTDIIFTSGGTESNNWVVYSAIKYYYSKMSEKVSPNDFKSVPLPHIVTTEVEHDAMIEPIQKLVEEGKAQASFIAVDPKTGSIDLEDVLRVLKEVADSYLLFFFKCKSEGQIMITEVTSLTHQKKVN